ncbi:MAG: peptidoglycan-associated lipoprotein Pal [Deltaproteobacteria bacterium]|nr:peptidoglycan-associated lipoprotein Pal [Deltaproteobacteria bacterium]
MKAARILTAVAVVAVAGAGLIACGQQKAAPGPVGLKRINFDFDKYNIKSEFVQTLKDNAGWIQKNAGRKVTVEGHCDERGTTEYNIGLGDRRAKSAKSYLVNLGVAGDRLSTISYGEERPLCTQHNESCWWQNRRAEFQAK